MIESAIATFGLVFLAELGDKSQLIVLALATRYRPIPVMAGIAVAAAAIMGLSVTVGVALAEVLPDDIIGLLAALLFFGFAIWALRSGGSAEADEVERATRRVGTRLTVLTVAVAFFIAEIGDKTMLATVALATQVEPLGVWVGGTLGIVGISGVAVLVGHQLGARLPARWIQLGSAALFAMFGVGLLVAVFVS